MDPVTAPLAAVVPVGRMAYTQYQRKHDKIGVSPAMNATPAYNTVVPGDLKGDVNVIETYKSASDSDSSLDTQTSNTTSSVAIFPQYTAQQTTTLTIREAGLNKLGDSFTVSNGSKDLFKVQRVRPSWRRRQDIIDCQTNEPIMSVIRNKGTLPHSFFFLDPSEQRICDVQGNFFVPGTGAESSAFLVNAETGNKIELTMKGSFRNSRAHIKNAETGETLVSMESKIWEARNVLAGRRTYDVKVRGGVDLAMVTAFIMALDARG